MEAPATAPAGFCPKCYYPIDPGVCPECGTEATADSILTSLSQTRAARAKRSARCIFLFIVVPFAAIVGAWYVPWPRLMPTSWLLSAHRTGWASRELVDRLTFGHLTSHDTQELLDRVVVTEVGIQCKAPVVSSMPYELEVHQIPWWLSAWPKTRFVIIDGS